jgi:hypothetical protein
MKYTHFIKNILDGAICGHKDKGRYIGTKVTYDKPLVDCLECKKLLEANK